LYPDGRVGQISIIFLSCTPTERFVLIDEKSSQNPVSLSSCPATARVVLLPEPDGKVGQVSVATTAGSQMLNQPWESTELVSTDMLPGQPKIMDEKEVKTIFKEALDAQPQPSAVFKIYFASGSADLTSVSLQSIQKAIEAINSQKSNHILVFGHTDTVASAEYNRKLSQQRAKSVADMLVSKGVERAHIEIEYYGKEKLLVATQDGVAEPKNRGVEIIVE
jgi:outer membrane protein OmpA-like peptidoglycan-associated protein